MGINENKGLVDRKEIEIYQVIGSWIVSKLVHSTIPFGQSTSPLEWVSLGFFHHFFQVFKL
jgi:hypothetical protein